MIESETTTPTSSTPQAEAAAVDTGISVRQIETLNTGDENMTDWRAELAAAELEREEDELAELVARETWKIRRTRRQTRHSNGDYRVITFDVDAYDSRGRRR